MFEIMNMHNDPIWELMDIFAGYPFNKESKIPNTGLRSCINRPHNLINVKDKDGNVIAQKLSVVTTPFKKDEVKVQVLDNILTVKCGAENKESEENEEVVYRGISSQTYEFSLRIADNVDKAAITAENVDGVLTIILPIIKKDEPKPLMIDVK